MWPISQTLHLHLGLYHKFEVHLGSFIHVICTKNRCYYIRNCVVVLIEILLFASTGVLSAEDSDNSSVLSCHVEEVHRQCSVVVVVHAVCWCVCGSVAACWWSCVTEPWRDSPNTEPFVPHTESIVGSCRCCSLQYVLWICRLVTPRLCMHATGNFKWKMGIWKRE